MGVCSHSEAVKKFEVPFDVKADRPTRFGSVYRCSECGLGFVKPKPDASQIATHYDLPLYYTHASGGHLPISEARFIDRVMIHLAWHLDRGDPFDPRAASASLKQGAYVLDIGCGAGNLLSKFRELGLTTFGVDPDPAAVAEAETKGHTVLTGTAESLPQEMDGKEFDFVTMTHVLEHCLDPVAALNNARKALSPDGFIYCEVPNAGSRYFESYGHISEMLDVPRHLFFFSKSNLNDAAVNAGLNITSWRHHGFTRHFNPSWKKWENSIFDRLVEAGIRPVSNRRSIIGDLALLITGALDVRERRYDCIGFFARRGDHT